MFDLLHELLKIDTTTGNTENIEASLDLIQEYIQSRLQDVCTTRFEQPNSSLVVTSKNIRNPDIFLVGHIDVVPAEYEKAFSPEVRNNRIYARGSSDMKGPLAVMIDSFITVLASEKDRTKSLGLMITSDEETGGIDGVNYLLNHENFKSKVAFIPDGAENWSLCVEEKALLRIKLTAEGKTAHGSRPWLGINANDLLIKTYMELKRSFIDKWGRANAQDKWKPTLNLGRVQGGTAANAVSDFAELWLDIRLPPDVDKSEVYALLDEFKNNNKSIDWNNEVYGSYMKTDLNNKYVRTWIELLKSFTPYKKKSKRLIKSSGASDARYFTANEIPVVMTKPTASPPHIKDEWIDLDDLKKFRKLIVKWLEQNL